MKLLETPKQVRIPLTTKFQVAKKSAWIIQHSAFDAVRWQENKHVLQHQVNQRKRNLFSE